MKRKTAAGGGNSPSKSAPIRKTRKKPTSQKKLRKPSKGDKITTTKTRPKRKATKGSKKSPTQRARSYPPEFRRKVAEYSLKHGISRASEKFGVSTPSVTNWRRSYGINREMKQKMLAGKTVRVPRNPKKVISGNSDRPRYSEQLRMEIAEYSILHGIQGAAVRYGVSSPSVTNWRREFGINRKTKKDRIKMMPSGVSQRISEKDLRRIRNQTRKALETIDALLKRY